MNVVTGKWPPRDFSFTVNGNTRMLLYSLVDGLFPRFASFVALYPNPQMPEQRTFNRLQEALRNNVERLFGILTARFHVMLHPCRMWTVPRMVLTVQTVAIPRIMVVEARRANVLSQSRSTHYGPCDAGGADGAGAGEVDGATEAGGGKVDPDVADGAGVGRAPAEGGGGAAVGDAAADAEVVGVVGMGAVSADGAGAGAGPLADGGGAALGVGAAREAGGAGEGPGSLEGAVTAGAAHGAGAAGAADGAGVSDGTGGGNGPVGVGDTDGVGGSGAGCGADVRHCAGFGGGGPRDDGEGGDKAGGAGAGGAADRGGAGAAVGGLADLGGAPGFAPPAVGAAVVAPMSKCMRILVATGEAKCREEHEALSEDIGAHVFPQRGKLLDSYVD